MNKFTYNLFTLFSLLSLILLSSCNPENALAKRLIGGWEITSYKLDGVEEMGNTIRSIEFKFEAYNGTEGRFTFTSLDVLDSTIVETGFYELNEDGDQMELRIDDGPTLFYGVWAKRKEMEMITDFGSAQRSYFGVRE